MTLAIFARNFICNTQVNIIWDCPLMMSDIRVGRGSKIAPEIGRYRVGQGNVCFKKKLD